MYRTKGSLKPPNETACNNEAHQVLNSRLYIKARTPFEMIKTLF